MKRQLRDFRPIILLLADYLLRRIAALFNEKDGMDSDKRMASNREVVVSSLLITGKKRTSSGAIDGVWKKHGTASGKSNAFGCPTAKTCLPFCRARFCENLPKAPIYRAGKYFARWGNSHILEKMLPV